MTTNRKEKLQDTSVHWYKNTLHLWSCLATHLCPTLATPQTVAHRFLCPWGFHARILEWVAMPSSRGYSQLRDWTCISCIGRWILYHWATREALFISYHLSHNHNLPTWLFKSIFILTDFIVCVIYYWWIAWERWLVRNLRLGFIFLRFIIL